jgi:hypothetical protein
MRFALENIVSLRNYLVCSFFLFVGCGYSGDEEISFIEENFSQPTGYLSAGNVQRVSLGLYSLGNHGGGDVNFAQDTQSWDAEYCGQAGLIYGLHSSTACARSLFESECGVRSGYEYEYPRYSPYYGIDENSDKVCSSRVTQYNLDCEQGIVTTEYLIGGFRRDKLDSSMSGYLTIRTKHLGVQAGEVVVHAANDLTLDGQSWESIFGMRYVMEEQLEKVEVVVFLEGQSFVMDINAWDPQEIYPTEVFSIRDASTKVACEIESCALQGRCVGSEDSLSW